MLNECARRVWCSRSVHGSWANWSELATALSQLTLESAGFVDRLLRPGLYEPNLKLAIV